jgi:ketosteroid isomerase-like protein
MLAGLVMGGAPVAAHEPAPKAVTTNAIPASARDAAKTVDAFHAALHRGDTNAASALLAEDALIFESGGVERTKAEYAAHHLPADAEFSRAVSSVVTRRAGHAAGILAWIASEGRTTGQYKGKPLDLLTTETMILRRTHGSWKIVHIHWSSTKSQNGAATGSTPHK